MEKRIKTLYIITIITILAFLGMQVYWLLGRYEISLRDQEDRIYNIVINVFEDHFNTPMGGSKLYSHYSLYHEVDTLGRKKFRAEITWYAREELEKSLPEGVLAAGRDNTEDINKSLEDVRITKRLTYDASNAPEEGRVWRAMNKVDLELSNPLSTLIIDSLLSLKKLKGESKLINLDSMRWESSMKRHESMIHPIASVNIPYSELERKMAEIEVQIPVVDILQDMWESLTIAILLSIFLILCLILQFKTVLRLSRLDKMRNSFITTMIHELKRPISTLKMCVSGLDNRRMVEDKEIREELLSETRNALDNLSAYFSKLRDITFNNVEQIPLNIQSINLHNLFDNVIDATVLPSGKTVVISNRIAPDAMVSADRSHLFNILNNLIENAVKYSRQEVEINASATAKERYVEIMISDNGNGISSGDLKHVFKRFYRGQASSGDQPGMGLGLAYVKLLVEAHGGEIDVESSEGEGSRFTIKLPQ